MKFFLFVVLLSPLIGYASKTLLKEDFEIDTNSTSTTLIQYDAWYRLGTTELVVEDGKILFQPQAPRTPNGIVSRESFSGDVELVAKIGRTNNSGGYHVGVMLGTNVVVFHTGYGSASGMKGHFRYEKWDPTLTYLEIDGGNLDMGFIPAVSVAHTVSMNLDSESGEVRVKVVDGLDDANQFEFSFTDVGLRDEFTVGFPTHGYFLEGTVFVEEMKLIQGSVTIEPKITVQPHDQRCTRGKNRPLGIQVTIHGDLDLDVTTIDYSTISAGGLELDGDGLSDGACILEYVDDDEFVDATCRFRTGDIPMNFSGSTVDGDTLVGEGSVCLK